MQKSDLSYTDYKKYDELIRELLEVHKDDKFADAIKYAQKGLPLLYMFEYDSRQKAKAKDKDRLIGKEVLVQKCPDGSTMMPLYHGALTKSGEKVAFIVKGKNGDDGYKANIGDFLQIYAGRATDNDVLWFAKPLN